MKKFLIQVLAVIVGISLVTGLFILGVIIIGVVSSPSRPSVKDDTVLEITLKQPIMESPAEKPSSPLSFNKGTTLYLRDILNLIKQAKNDEKIKGISLNLEDVEGGYAQISEIRQALQDFKQSKKFVYAYSVNGSSQKAYYLASVADSIFLNPNGMIELAGLSAEVLFYKNFGEKYGIGFDIFRHGKYKSAVEPFMRDKMSDENRQQYKELLDDIWSKVSSDISQSRKLPMSSINLAADSLYGFVAEYAVAHNLTDRLVTESQYYDIIKKKLGVANDKKINKISLAKYKEVTDLNSSSDNKIAVLYASGEIYSGKGDDGVYSETIIKQIKDIKEDDNIKAVVLRVNSPGGDAGASAEILYELNELKKKKPLIVSFGEYAASGGYYISMAADKIYAQEGTITGSIGVLGMFPNVKKLSNNLGITTDYVETNANSRYYSWFEGFSDKTKATITQSIEIFYKKFVGVVMNNRKKTFEQVDALGGGRVWSGKQALKNGLIDEIGTFNDAIAFAAQKAKLKDYQVVDYPKEKSDFERFMDMFSSKDDDDDDTQVKVTENLLREELGAENFRLYQKIKNIQQQKGILYLMPFELEIK